MNRDRVHQRIESGRGNLLNVLCIGGELCSSVYALLVMDRGGMVGEEWGGGEGMIRGGTIPEITMRYVSRYLSHDTIRITILH